MVRPESVSLHRDGEGVPGVVRRAFFMGMSAEYFVDTDLGQLAVTDTRLGAALEREGEKVRLRFDPVGCYLLPGSDHAGTARAP